MGRREIRGRTGPAAAPLAGWGQASVCPAGPPPVYLDGLTFSAGSLRPAGGDPPSLVAGEQLARRASSRLFLEIDVGQRLAVAIPASLMRLFQMHHLARLSFGLFRLV